MDTNQNTDHTPAELIQMEMQVATVMTVASLLATWLLTWAYLLPDAGSRDITGAMAVLFALATLLTGGWAIALRVIRDLR